MIDCPNAQTFPYFDRIAVFCKKPSYEICDCQLREYEKTQACDFRPGPDHKRPGALPEDQDVSD